MPRPVSYACFSDTYHAKHHAITEIHYAGNRKLIPILLLLCAKTNVNQACLGIPMLPKSVLGAVLSFHKDTASSSSSQEWDSG